MKTKKYCGHGGKWYTGICRRCGITYRGKGQFYCSRKCYRADPEMTKQRQESMTKAQIEFQRKHSCKSKEWFTEQYISQKKSMQEIANELYTAINNVRYWMDKYNIPRRKSWETLIGRYPGDKAPNWKGGRIKTSEGYICIYAPNHPLKTKTNGGRVGGYVLEHRLIMEKHLGRHLEPWEIVHHINGIRDDNCIENLQLLPTGEHNKEVQQVYQENQKLKEAVMFLYGLIARMDVSGFGKGAI